MHTTTAVTFLNGLNGAQRLNYLNGLLLTIFYDVEAALFVGHTEDHGRP